MNNTALYLLNVAWHDRVQILSWFHESRELSSLAGWTLKARTKVVVSLPNPEEFGFNQVGALTDICTKLESGFRCYC